MTTDDKHPPNATDALRRRAEEIALEHPNPSPDGSDNLSLEETHRTLHELRVHQIELEMQNEELRQMQVELEIARARYFDLYDLAPTGYITVNEKGLILEANLTISTLLGAPRNALVMHPFSRFIAREDQDIYYAHRKQLFETSDPQSCDLRLVKSDGAPFWTRLEAVAARDAGGSPTCRIVLNDITERKQMEEVQVFLAQTSSGTEEEPFFEALARYLAHSLDMDYVCIDRLVGDGLTARTVAVWCDGHFEDNISYALKDTPCGEVKGKVVCCYPASVRKFFPRDQALDELQAESYVGVTLWSHTGQPNGLIAVIGRKPLANRRLAEEVLKMVAVRAAGELERLDAIEVLRESNAYLDNLFNYANAPIIVWDPQLGITRFNHAFESLTGWTADEVLGKKLELLFPPSQVQSTMELIQRTLMGERWQTVEIEILHRDGTIRTVLWNSATLFHTDGETPAATIAQGQDITERIKVERALRKALVDVRTLHGIIPICMHCKQIRDDKGYWNQVEAYVSDHSEAEFSHGICPECMRKLYPGFDLGEDEKEGGNPPVP